MLKKILHCANYSEAFDKVAEMIRSRKVDLSVRHIVLVPDKYTLAFERALYKDNFGAFDVEVMTFNRLFNKLCPQKDEYISRESGIMLIKGLALQSRDKLKCFQRSCGFRGFAEKIYDTLAMIKSSNINIADLNGEGSLKEKLDDIKLLGSMYYGATEGKYVDAGGRMDLLSKYVKTDKSVANTHYYIVNFDSLTNKAKEIIDLINERALSVTISKTDKPILKLCNDAEVYRAVGMADEFKAAATRIRDYVFNGGRYGDIAVVAPDFCFETVKRIMTEFEIPYFVDYKTKLFDHALSRFINSVLEASTRGRRRRQMVSIAKNFYSGVGKDDAYAFENYCERYSIDYLSFFKPFEICRDESLKEELEAAEGTRIAVNKLINIFENALKNGRYRNGFVSGAAALIDGVKALRRDSEFAPDEKDENKITAALMSVEKLMPSTSVSVASESFFEGLKATGVSKIPAYADTVTIGEAEVFRGQRYPFKLVIGFNDGAIPKLTSDSGLITDKDIDIIKTGGTEISPKVADVNERAADEIIDYVSNADKLFISYDGGLRPSGLVLDILDKGAEFTFSDDAEMLKESDCDKIAKYCSSIKRAVEIFLTKSGGGYESTPDFLPSLYSAVKPCLKDYSLNPSSKKYLSRADLFFRSGFLSASQLQTFFVCPYRHFLGFGLRLCERETGSLNAPDMGNFLHKIMEIFVSKGDFDDVGGSVRRIVDSLTDSNFKYLIEANKGVIERLKADAEVIADIIVKQLRQSSFVNKFVEKRFPDSSDGFKSISLDVGSGEVFVKGMIDRVDVYGDYARVIDYKSGSKEVNAKINYSELYYGIKLQLMLYMETLIINGYRPGGMFYFPLNFNFTDDENSMRLRGLYNDDFEVVIAHDNALANGGVSSLIEARSGIKKGAAELGLFGANPHAVGEDNLVKLCGYAVAAIEKASRAIREGYISPKPYRKDGKTSCEYCPFGVVCGKNFSAFRELQALKIDDILNAADNG